MTPMRQRTWNSVSVHEFMIIKYNTGTAVISHIAPSLAHGVFASLCCPSPTVCQGKLCLPGLVDFCDSNKLQILI